MPISPSQPAPQQSTPYVPTTLEPFIFELFEGINTTTTRPGVSAKQAYWIDGFMPVAERNLRTLYDLGTTLFTRTASLTIVFFEFYNLNGIPYMIAFMSDGSAVQVNVATQVTTTIMSAGTILNPTITNVGASQWGQTYLLIVAGQTNGYWVWDGRVLYTAGTLAPVITLTNVGQGYINAPAVNVTGGTGSGATITAIIANGVVTGFNIVSAGSGYSSGDSVVLTLSGGTTSGTGGSVSVASIASVAGGSGGTVNVVGMQNVGGGIYYSISSISIVSVGSGYSQFTNISVYTPFGIAQSAIITPIIGGGTISSLSIVNGGLYTNADPAQFTETVSDSGYFYVASVSIVAVGSNYSPNYVITATGGSSAVTQATFKGYESNGTITSVVITGAGVYGGTLRPSLVITDTASLASATATLMPFGIQGTSVETYQGYVWIVSGATLYNSAPGSISNFATSAGGGNKTTNSSKLRIGYTRLIAANGFLYTIADSSIDVVSGVQTSGSISITTTYSWLNADPESGSPYPEGVMTWGRGLFFANAFGIHTMFGSQAQKISEPLDGVYNSVANFSSMQLSVAEHQMFGRKVAVALVPVVDPITSASVAKLLCYDGKRWFASSQSKTLTYIKHQEINSSITAYGTDGTIVAPLFATASAAFTKRVQTGLYDGPGGYQMDKAASRFWAIGNYNSSVSTSMVVRIDALDNLNSLTSATYTIAGPSVTGLFATPPEAVGQQGPLIGMTLQTNCPDFQLISAMFQPEIAEYRG